MDADEPREPAVDRRRPEAVASEDLLDLHRYRYPGLDAALAEPGGSDEEHLWSVAAWSMPRSTGPSDVPVRGRPRGIASRDRPSGSVHSGTTRTA
jgi:hypothetical protein